MLEVLAGAIVGAVGNRYAGMEKGNRYLPAAVFWGLLCVFYGIEATVFGLAYLFWRTIGWHDSIDMGRNEGTFWRDFGTLMGISALPALTIMVMYPDALLLLWLVLAPPLCYTAAMRGLPWNPKYKHIAVAEILSGAVLGATAVLVVS